MTNFKRIFMIGYMGSGKTSLGKKLAENLHFSFVDMDAHIEEKYHKTVSEIFAELGQEKFREIEKECLHEIGDFENTIISTGGGAPCFYDNIQYMNEKGLTIYLNLTIEQLAVRLENSRAGKRPLLADKKGEALVEFIRNGLEQRLQFYEQAQLIVGGNDDEMLEKIMNALQN